MYANVKNAMFSCSDQSFNKTCLKFFLCQYITEAKSGYKLASERPKISLPENQAISRCTMAGSH